MARRKRQMDGADEYGMSHRPNDSGPPLHDMLEGGLAPADIYTAPPSWYTGYEDLVWETVSQMRRCRGKPDCRVSIYRAGPKRELNTGDWVSLSAAYARQHRDAMDPATYEACKFRVEAKDVRWAGDDLIEWGYFGPPKKTSAVFCSKNRKEWVAPKKRSALSGIPKHGPIPMAQVQRAMKLLGRKVQKCRITPALLREGMAVEREHADVTKLAIGKTARIAAAHICERRDYYRRIKRYVEK